jgi:hypothetical protein
LVTVPGGTAQPFAAAMLLDQSGSIAQSDQRGARLYSVKTFLDRLGPQDQALLAVFAGGPEARIPTTPLTAYLPSKGQDSAREYFATLDGLPPLVAGNTPLHESLERLMDEMAADATLPLGLLRSIVVFTDGNDTGCLSRAACATARERVAQRARADQVRIFTIGLSGGIDFEALGELAHATGGAFLYGNSAEQLIPLYGSVGRMLSLSLPTYRLQWTVETATAGTLQSRSKLLGMIEVAVDGTTVDVPLVVGMP